MQISVKAKNFEIAFDYNPAVVAEVKKLPGRKWNPDSKRWTIPVAESISLKSLLDRIKDDKVEFDASAEVIFLETLNRSKQSLIDSSSSRAEIDIPSPAGCAYLPYQVAGINYALGRESTLIADEMGLGKSIQAIGFANAITATTVLIVCPASLRLNWLKEWNKWDTLNRPAEVVRNGKQEFPKSPVVIINYDLIGKFDIKQEFDLLILDECHYLKNPKSSRTKAVFGYFDKTTRKAVAGLQAKRKLLLTGTPILNRPIEAYPLLKAIAPEQFGNWKHFTDRYCDAQQTRYGLDITGASNLGELQERLRVTCMVRRMKADVLTELPSKRRQMIEIEDGAVKKESKAWAAYQTEIDKLSAAVELSKCGTDEEFKSAVDKLNEVSSAAFSEMSRIRHETAIAKIPHAIEFITEALESSQKIVVFAHHKDVVKALQGAFKNSVSLTGEASLDDRQRAVDLFQNDPGCQIFIGNIKAAGVGITLTAASHVIFVELDWVPGNMSQAEDRCHRIGQRDTVLVQHLVLQNSLDATISKRLIEKQDLIDRALDADIVKDDSIIPVASYLETPVKTIREESINITDEESAVALAGVKKLAAFCDGAQAIDGMGFSKVDSYIGHSLAALNTLSKKQAVIAKKLCYKYRRQLA